jgi:crossover junction endodeoxyribonuclease RusA
MITLPTFTCTLPLPPSFNQQYFTNNGYHVLTPESRRYRSAVEFRMQHLYRQDKVGEQFLAALKRLPISLLLRFYFETPHRRDLDSGLKILLDAVLTGGLGVDDVRVADLRLLKQIDPLNPRVELELNLMEDWDWQGTDIELFAPFSLRLPMAPSVNEQYAIVNGRRHRSTELRRFRKAVAEIVSKSGMPEQLPESLRGRKSKTHLACYLDFFFAKGSQRDVDSGIKATLDAVCEAAKLNDNRVVDLHCTRRISSDEPHILAQFEPLEDWVFERERAVLVPSDSPGELVPKADPESLPSE